MRLTLIQEFSSRRNNVCLAKTDLGESVIHKRYACPQGMAREQEVLSLLSLSGYAPKVLKINSDSLVNEYIEGDILYDKYKVATATDDTVALANLARQLSVFMQIFYSMFDGKILGEINFKNYIFKDNRCYGIDFEKVREGMQYSDIGAIVANALVYASGDASSSFPFIRELIKSFHLAIIDILNDTKIELERMILKDKIIVDMDYLLRSLLFLSDDSDRIKA